MDREHHGPTRLPVPRLIIVVHGSREGRLLRPVSVDQFQAGQREGRDQALLVRSAALTSSQAHAPSQNPGQRIIGAESRRVPQSTCPSGCSGPRDDDGDITDLFYLTPRSFPGEMLMWRKNLRRSEPSSRPEDFGSVRIRIADRCVTLSLLDFVTRHPRLLVPRRSNERPSAPP